MLLFNNLCIVREKREKGKGGQGSGEKGVRYSFLVSRVKGKRGKRESGTLFWSPRGANCGL